MIQYKTTKKILKGLALAILLSVKYRFWMISIFSINKLRKATIILVYFQLQMFTIRLNKTKQRCSSFKESILQLLLNLGREPTNILARLIIPSCVTPTSMFYLAAKIRSGLGMMYW